MFAGEHVNVSEDRAALHVALRAPRGDADRDRRRGRRPGGPRGARPDGASSPSACAPAPGPARPASAIRTVVNIGIGGSYLGPEMAALALAAYAPDDLDAALPLERRRQRLLARHARPRPGRDARDRRVEDVHDARDDDQRADDARLDRRRARRGRRRPARRRGLDERAARARRSASTRRTCSASGTGSAGATRWTRRSACRR